MGLNKGSLYFGGTTLFQEFSIPVFFSGQRFIYKAKMIYCPFEFSNNCTTRLKLFF